MSKTIKIALISAAVGITILLLYAISPSGHISGGCGEECRYQENAIMAGQIVGIAADIQTSISQLQKNGISIKDIDFSKLNFSNSNVSIQDMLSPASYDGDSLNDNRKHYVFTLSNKISGTDTPALLFVTWPIKQEVCYYINKPSAFHPLYWWLPQQLIQYNGWAEDHILDTPPDLTPAHHETGKPLTEIPLPLSLIEGYHSIRAACMKDKSGIRYFIFDLLSK